MDVSGPVHYFRIIIITNPKFETIIYWWWKCGAFILSLAIISLIILLYPVFLVIEWYLVAIFLKGYRYFKSRFQEFTSESWNGVRKQLSILNCVQARFWYGYEIQDAENIPSKGPALIVFYHGAIPMDCLYLISSTLLRQNRMICIVAEKLFFKFPAMDAFLDFMDAHPDNVDYCAERLQDENLMIIAPGGTREAFFGDENYQLVWEKRIGFAKIAFKAKVPIIPVFTRNIREAFPTLNFGKSFLRSIYEKFGIPIPLIFGGFPVKLTTFIGEPIPHDPTLSPEEIAEKVKQGMQNLISLHQQTPGSIARGVKERIQHLLHRKHS